jgi:hypothetical protein
VTARFADPIAGSQGTVTPVDAPHDGGPSVAVHGDTMVFTVPRPSAPAARLRVIDRDRGEHRPRVRRRPLTIGRAADNDLVLADSRVSRTTPASPGARDARLPDLGSTNGSRVNGVQSGLVLGAGDRIELGDTVIMGRGGRGRR